jgi:hypothetical protein
MRFGGSVDGRTPLASRFTLLPNQVHCHGKLISIELTLRIDVREIPDLS